MTTNTSTSTPEEVEAQRLYGLTVARFPQVRDETFARIMEQALKDNNISITHTPIRGAYLRAATNLTFAKKLPKRSIIHIFTDGEISNPIDGTEYMQEIFVPERKTHVMFVCSSFVVKKIESDGTTDYKANYLLLTFGDKRITALINMQLNYGKLILLDIPADTLISTPLSAISNCKMIAMSEFKPEAIMCTPYELVAIMKQSQISPASKLASMLVMCYPYTRNTLIDFCDFSSFELYKISKELTAMTVPTPTEIDIENSLRCIVGILLLGFSFTQVDNKARQIAKRIAAVTSVILCDTFPAEKITTALTEFHLKEAMATPYVDRLLQAVICVDAEGEVSSFLTESQLFIPSPTSTDFPLHAFESKILLQARMVYKYYHNTSIRWAADFSHSLQDYSSINVAALSKEISHINSIREDLRQYPYLGIQFEIPEKYQIKNCPLLCWAGVKYRARLLLTKEERDLFEKYNIKSIETHIEQKELMVTMNSLVEMQPSINVCAAVATIISDSLDNVEPLVSRLSLVEKEDMFRLIGRKIVSKTASDLTGGEWYRTELLRRRHEDLKITTGEARTYVGNQLAIKVDELQSAADEIDDRELRRQTLAKIREYKARVERALTLEGEFESAFSAPIHNISIDFKNGLIKYFEQVFDMVRSGDVNAKSPPRFDVRAAIRAQFSTIVGTSSENSSGSQGTAVEFSPNLMATNPAANTSGAIPTGNPGIPPSQH